VARTGSFTVADLRGFVVVSFTSFWAEFGWLNLLFPPAVYVVLAAVCGLGLAGALAELWRERKNYGPGFWMVTLALLAVYVSLLRYIQTINASGYQGRLLFPAIPSLALLLVLGLARLAGRRWTRPVLATLGGGLLLLAVTALAGLIRPAYAPPGLYEPGTLAGRLVQPCLRFGDQVELAAYHFDPPAVRPGETLQVTLHWHALADRPQPPALAVGLQGQTRRALAGDTLPTQGWRRGKMFTTHHSLTIPDGAQPARGLLSLEWRDDEGESLPVSTVRGRSLGDAAELGGFKIAPPPTAASPQYPTTAFFGQFVALRGYDLLATSARPGETLNLTLHWEALAPASADYTVFSHLIDAQGHPVAQADGQPLGGVYPTTIWEAGERIADQRSISLAGDVPPGDYSLGVGWYLLETGERLPATGGDGNRLPGDMAILGTVRVEKEEAQ